MVPIQDLMSGLNSGPPRYHGEPLNSHTYTSSEPNNQSPDIFDIFLGILFFACLASICASFFGYGIGFTGAAAGFWGALFIWISYDEGEVGSFLLGLLPISVLYLFSNVFVNGIYFGENFLQPFLLSFIPSLISPGLFHLIKQNRISIRNHSSQFFSFFIELVSNLIKKLWVIFYNKIQVLLQSKKGPISRNPRMPPSRRNFDSYYAPQKSKNSPPPVFVRTAIINKSNQIVSNWSSLPPGGEYIETNPLRYTGSGIGTWEERDDDTWEKISSNWEVWNTLATSRHRVSGPDIVKGSSHPINFENVTVKQLKKMLEERENITSGNKSDLIKRLREDNLLPEERSWIK